MDVKITRKKTILFTLLLLLIFSLNAKTKAEKYTSSDKCLCVTAEDDGLHITKKHKPKFVHVRIMVESEGKSCLSILADEKHNSFVYPFVDEGKEYTIYLVMMDSSWGSWTQTQPVTVKAKLGSGEYSIQYSSYHYDNDSASIVFSDYQVTKPQNLKHSVSYYSGNVFEVKGNEVCRSNPSWKKYSEKNGVINLSSNIQAFANKTFCVELEFCLFYKGMNFISTILDNSKNPFEDFHPLEEISLSQGALQPVFNPAIFNYNVKGSLKDVTLSLKTTGHSGVENHEYLLKAKDDECVTFTVKEGEKNQTYTFKYKKDDVFDFEGKKYIQTFYDDFDGNQLDFSKWQRCEEEERQPKAKNHGWWRDDCSYLDGKGNLVIDAKRDGERLVSGAIESYRLFEQSHGYYEIKFKCEKTSGMWYAFWLMGANDEDHIGNGAVDAAEIDIFELVPTKTEGGPNYFRTSINWDSYGPEQKAKTSRLYNVTDDFYDQWHIVKFIWDNDFYRFYLDGQFLWEMAGEDYGGICEGANWIIISSEFGDWGGQLNEDDIPAKMYVDYVRAASLVK